jgi:small-conductance mechanosensitive channel
MPFHTLAVLLAQAEPDPEALAKTLELFDLTKLTVAAVIIAAGFFGNRVVQVSLENFGEGNAKRRLFFKKIQSFSRLAILVVCVYLLAMTFFGGDGDNRALLGLGGTLAVAVGFALKDTASSLMSGILILIDQPFQVGDRVQFGDTYGEVKEIGLRSVRIVTLDDNEVSIPNNKFLTESVSSGNSGALDMMVVVKYHIAVTEDFELAKRLVYEAVVTSKYVFLHKPVTILVKEEVTAIAFATVIVAKAYVIDTRYEMAFVSDVTERVKRAFRHNDIQQPFMRESHVAETHWDVYHRRRETEQALAEHAYQPVTHKKPPVSIKTPPPMAVHVALPEPMPLVVEDDGPDEEAVEQPAEEPTEGPFEDATVSGEEE